MPTTSGSKKKSARASVSGADSAAEGTTGRRARTKKSSVSATVSDRPELSNEANFPPCYPIIRHSLGDLITPLKKACAIYSLILWGVNIVVLLLNFVGSFFFLGATGGGSDASYVMILVSFLYLIIIPIPSIFTHYWPLYLACRSGNAIMYVLFVIFWGIEILFNAVMIIGVPYTGSCGILTIIILLFSQSWVSLAVHLIVFVCWIVLIIMELIGIVLMYPNYKADNGNLVEIQNQIISRVRGIRAKAALGGVPNVV